MAVKPINRRGAAAATVRALSSLDDLPDNKPEDEDQPRCRHEDNGIALGRLKKSPPHRGRDTNHLTMTEIGSALGLLYSLIRISGESEGA
jgi:hypothetical protein